MKKGFAVCLLILFLLMLTRFAFPDTAEGIREALLPESGRLSETAEAIGRGLTAGEGAVYVWDGETPSSVYFYTEAPSPESTPSPIPSPSPESTPSPTPEPSYTPIPEPSPEPLVTPSSAAIDEFWAAQEAFAGSVRPQNVSYMAPDLSFPCAPPVAVSATDGFGFRSHPIYGDVRFHNGADYPVADGTPIAAFASGTVSDVSAISGFGNTLTIDHGNGFSSFYAHLQSASVRVGDWVELGQTVALSGRSGNVTGPHLHFCLLWEGKYINPLFYI